MSAFKKSGVLIILALALAVGIVAVLSLKDKTSPETSLTPGDGFISAKTAFKLKTADPDSGLAEIRVLAVQGETETIVVKEKMAGRLHSAERDFDLSGLKLKEGRLTLRVTVVDNSLANWGNGNYFRHDFEYAVDSKPPVLTLISRVHNVNQGGSAVVAYNISKTVARTGVRVGERFFPGFRQPDGFYLCMFTYPWDVAHREFKPQLMAQDDAGNIRELWLPYHANPKTFRNDKINVTDGFLNNVVPQFQHLYPDLSEPVDVYVKVNREIRKQNIGELFRIGQQTANVPLWTNEFLRQPNAAPRAGFADRRTYFYKNKPIDEQTHMGVDLASLEHAEVPAANSGKVVFSGDLGIYGLTVIIDHGLGLMSIYGHLSASRVEPGSGVTKGDIIGNTGMSGMAGGDHLHYEMMVSGVPVTPVEWWDPHWITNNVASRLQGKDS